MASNSLLDDFYNSYLNCFSILANHNCTNLSDSDELKSTADQCIQKFIDNARKMEMFFLEKRLLLASQRPDFILAEEIKEIDVEIKRKEEIIKQFYDKLAGWQNMLANDINPSAASRSQRF